ncbi:hypothetical protein E2C01_080408 [Portunus trituberculatus]|uniref:Uncharacterized protein n=1 Tax=Portunus trituberculatus TaxID=210409 RepID=A0A5B7IW22_PORTR|nr:hypothetical protein [Portunus trituberculatus]
MEHYLCPLPPPSLFPRIPAQTGYSRTAAASLRPTMRKRRVTWCRQHSTLGDDAVRGVMALRRHRRQRGNSELSLRCNAERRPGYIDGDIKYDWVKTVTLSDLSPYSTASAMRYSWRIKTVV